MRELKLTFQRILHFAVVILKSLSQERQTAFTKSEQESKKNYR